MKNTATYRTSLEELADGIRHIEIQGGQGSSTKISGFPVGCTKQVCDAVKPIIEEKRAEEKTYDSLEYDGKTWPLRSIVLPATGEQVLIGTVALEQALRPDDGHAEWKDRKAQAVDERIFYYAIEEEFNLPAEELSATVEREALGVEMTQTTALKDGNPAAYIGEEDKLWIDVNNNSFNQELERYISGDMKKSEMLHLGLPTGVMKGFLPELPIVVRQNVLHKGSEKKHNINLEMLHNMPGRISAPIFVFKRDDNSVGILTEMKDQQGLNVCVAIALAKEIQDGKEMLVVNDLRSIHGRNVEDILYPILQNNSLRWTDKQKGLAWLSSASHYVRQEIAQQDLACAAKVIKDFDNTKFFRKKIKTVSYIDAYSLQEKMSSGEDIKEMMQENTEERLLSDEDTEKQYSYFKVNGIKFYSPNQYQNDTWSGVVDLEFPNADHSDFDETMSIPFISYDKDGKHIAFDHRMPEETYKAVCDYILAERPKHLVMEAMIERTIDSSAKAFTPEQQQVILNYLKDFDGVDKKMQALSPLWEEACKDYRMDVYDEWKEPVKEELNDLASGIVRDNSRGRTP